MNTKTIRVADATNTHPKVLTETFAVYDHSPTGQALRTWQELYPDGSLRSFREIWVVVTAASGTRYGGVQVTPT